MLRERQTTGLTDLAAIDGGNSTIPATFHRERGIAGDGTVIVEVADGGLRIRSRNAALANLRLTMRQLVPAGVSLVDELIAERRFEAAKKQHMTTASASRGRLV